MMFIYKHKWTAFKVFKSPHSFIYTEGKIPQPNMTSVTSSCPVTKIECLKQNLFYNSCNIPVTLPGLARRERAWWVLNNRTHGVFTDCTLWSLAQASPENRGLEQLVATTRRRLAIGDTRRSCAVGTTLLLHVREREREREEKKWARWPIPQCSTLPH